MGLQAYLTLAAVLFTIGLFGVITRRNREISRFSSRMGPNTDPFRVHDTG